MKRLAAVFLLAVALAPAAHAQGLGLRGGPQPFHPETSAPTGLRAFLLRPDEAKQQYFPRTPSFAWDPVRAKGGSYEFELATSRTFGDSAVLFRYTKVKIPAIAVDHQLPWMTGLPYALWAHVRWVSADGKQITPWSQAYGFNMRWKDDDYPQQLPAPAGLVRWKPIEGATGYEVLYPDWKPAVAFTTTTNVADEREFYTLHESFGVGSVRWRVRAIRYINDKDVLSNGLPRVTYGPWSRTFVSVNPPLSFGALSPTDTVSEGWVKKGDQARPHELTPGFAWTPSAAVLGDIGPFGSSLYRVYVFTDDHCVNRVFIGSVVGSPAFAPRTTGGPLALPTGTKLLSDWMLPPYLTTHGNESNTYDATGKALKPNETPGSSVATGGPVDASGSSAGGAAAAVDLWDSGWPTGRYYWTVVPVTVQTVGTFDPKANDQPIEYQDTAIPQDSCEAGLGMSFGKVSQPVVTTGSKMPYVSGLAPSGRYVATASKQPEVHDSPLVAWEPAIGATSYQLELSRKVYPWKAERKLTTFATSAVLPLQKNDAGVWFYRIRGVNPSLPPGAQTMSWSAAVRIKITGDQFVVVK
jgi:hypothetical protein